MKTVFAISGTQQKTLRLWLLASPAMIFFLIFFVIPILGLLLISLDKPTLGTVDIQWMFDFRNYERFFSKSLYYSAALRSAGLSILVSFLTLLIGYPFAYLIAKAKSQKAQNSLMMFVLCAMQLDMVIRLFGLMVLMGDKGIINEFLSWAGFISDAPLPLMYNSFGVVVGLVQFSLPFMILSLVGTIRSIHPSLEEAARSLGARPKAAFWRVTIPLSMPGILVGLLLVFAISFSSYVVPTLMGGWKVVVLPIHIYQQIAELGKWQFGAAVAVVMFGMSLCAMLIYQRAAINLAGGRT